MNLGDFPLHTGEPLIPRMRLPTVHDDSTSVFCANPLEDLQMKKLILSRRVLTES
jgi:hypothetical protein